MRKQYHWSLKMIALILVAVSAAGLALGGACTIYNLNMGMYGDVDLDEKVQSETQEYMEMSLYDAAYTLAAQYLMENNTRENTVERDLWQEWFNPYWYWSDDSSSGYAYTIRSSSGVQLANYETDPNTEYAASLIFSLSMDTGTIVDLGYNVKEFPEWSDVIYAQDYEWTDFSGNELPGLNSQTQSYELADYGNHTYRIEIFDPVQLQVEIFLTESQQEALTNHTSGILLMKTCYRFREFDIATAIVSAIVLVAATVYLCFAAGKRPGTDEIRPRFTNCIPLDLYAFAGGFCVIACAALGFSFLKEIEYIAGLTYFRLLLPLYSLCAMAMALLAVMFLMALCAQVRLGNGAWLKRTVVGRCWSRFWGWCKRGWHKIFGTVDLDGGKAKGLLTKAVHWFRGAYKTLPMMWQWLVLYGGLFLLTLWVASTFRYHSGIAFLMVAIFGFLIVLYTGYGFGRLRDAAKRMSDGDLDTKINTYNEFLYGNFAEFAEDLNRLGDTCVDAAHEKMKSERMKSELITNVSHDIKTPLTSIINYVDLLQKAQTEEERKEYLEVLDRQSQRLKKLIEDLMEMSKASSGNVTADITENDLIEAINQALGEFSDRMGNLDLKVMFRQKDETLTAKFDGKLLWRVMSNVLSNVVKYALPGTRVYVDVLAEGNKVTVSFKNISRESLNITADELMERFVRGDASRYSEGNGLGLNIAKSLMEVMGGDLSLTVDGDLFKVILTLTR